MAHGNKMPTSWTVIIKRGWVYVPRQDQPLGRVHGSPGLKNRKNKIGCHKMSMTGKPWKPTGNRLHFTNWKDPPCYSWENSRIFYTFLWPFSTANCNTFLDFWDSPAQIWWNSFDPPFFCSKHHSSWQKQCFPRKYEAETGKITGWMLLPWKNLPEILGCAFQFVCGYGNPLVALWDTSRLPRSNP